MKVLIAADCLEMTASGIVSSMMGLQKELMEKGHDVRLLVLSNVRKSGKEKGTYYISLSDLKKIHFLNNYDAFCSHVFLRELTAWGPDIVHSQSELLSFRLAGKIAYKCKSYMIHTYHGYEEDTNHAEGLSGTLKRKLRSFRIRKLLQNVNTIITPSEHIKMLLLEHKVRKPVISIPTGIDLNRFSIFLSGKEKSMMKHILNIPQNHRVLITVGKKGSESNIRELLGFMAELLKLKESFTLLVAGSGFCISEMKRIAKDYKIESHVVFTGMIEPEHMPKYFKSCDLFVNNTDSATTGLALLEAMASGLPVISKKNPALDQVLLEGCNGFSYESCDSFCSCILKSTVSACDYLRLSGFAELATEQYSSWTFADRVEEIYRGRFPFAHGKPVKLPPAQMYFKGIQQRKEVI